MSNLSYGADGRLTYRHDKVLAPESELDRYLIEARAVFDAARASAPVSGAPTPHTEMTAEFERLRWFDLPDICLEEATDPAGAAGSVRES